MTEWALTVALLILNIVLQAVLLHAVLKTREGSTS